MPSARLPKDLAPCPLVSVDVALFGLVDGGPKVMLVRRGNEPERHRGALPGGMLVPTRDASPEDTARRVPADEAGLHDVPFLVQVRVFGGRDRDPRGRRRRPDGAGRPGCAGRAAQRRSAQRTTSSLEAPRSRQ